MFKKNFYNNKNILNIHFYKDLLLGILYSCLYFLSFINPNPFCFFSFFDSINLSKFNLKKIIIIKELIKFILLSFPFILWIYFYIYKNTLVLIFYLYLLTNVFVINYIYLLIFFKIIKIYKINSKIKLIILDNIYYTLINFTLYYWIGYLFTKKCICPFYLGITPIAYYKNLLIFFHYFNPWIYFFIINLIFKIIFEYFKFKKTIFFIIFIFIVINLFKKKFKNSYKSQQYSYSYLKKIIKKFKNKKKIFIFREEFIPLKNSFDIEKIKKLSKKYNITVITGAILKFREDNLNIERNCALTIKNGNLIEIKKKKHLLRFCESKNFHYNLFKKYKIKIQKSKYNIKICSEILLNKIKKHKKNKILIIITSKEWTNNQFTFIYKDLIDCIKNLHILYN